MTAATITYITHKDTRNTAIKSEEASARNILHLIQVNIEGIHRKLLADKIEMSLNIQRYIKSSSAVCKSVLFEYRELSRAGVLSENEAQAKFINWVKSATFNIGTLFISDQNASIIANPNPRIQWASLGSIKDIKGTRIEEMLNASRLKDEGEFAVFFWQRTEGGAKKTFGLFRPILAMALDYRRVGRS